MAIRLLALPCWCWPIRKRRIGKGRETGEHRRRREIHRSRYHPRPLPGKAEAAGFKPIELAADVKANKATVFDSILLRRVGTLAEESSLNTDSKYATRRARGTVFQHRESEKETVERLPTILPWRSRTARPKCTASSTPSARRRQAPTGKQSSFAGANFALSEQLADDVNLVVSGQAGLWQRRAAEA